MIIQPRQKTCRFEKISLNLRRSDGGCVECFAERAESVVESPKTVDPELKVRFV